MASLCTSLRTTVVMATYRLSPEHPFPTPLDDSEAAWNWLVDHAGERGIDPSRIAIGGESAGGRLTAMLTNRLHDKRDSGALQPAAQWMFCPMLDERTAADRRLDDERHPLWNNRSNLVGWRSFLGTEPGSATVPEGSVPSRRDDLTGLAPAWIGSGTVDLFYEEDAAYARALADAGVNVTLDEVPGAAPSGNQSGPRREAGPRPFRSMACREARVSVTGVLAPVRRGELVVDDGVASGSDPDESHDE